MRKLYCTLFLFICFAGFSQTKNYYHNSWRLGLNLGGMWQSSDMNKNSPGFAGGFTLEKGLLENESHFFSLAIRGRGLFGSTYGYGSKKNYNIASNPALNGTYNKEVNYSDTIGGPKQFVYNNYKTQISEGALELQISFNELREKTHVILNLWGGVGFTVYRTNTNLLDANGKIYDFSKIDSTGSNTNIIRSQRSFIDNSYESYAFGSKNGDLFTFSPSCGIGLGYQFSKNFSILFEYKLTFPQGINADILDGHVGVNNHWLAGNNDFYHYTGVNFLFTLGRGKKSSSSSSSSNTNTTPVNTNTVASNNNLPTTTNPVVVQNNVPVKPTVQITNPGASPSNVYSSVSTVQSKVYNVNQRAQISITHNGAAVTNYAFSGNDISFQVNLDVGNNNVVVSASNQAGSDSKAVILNYVGNPPTINITNPLSNPFTTTNAAATVYATILNVASSNDVQVKLNGNPTTAFSFDPQNNQFSIALNLINGKNALEVTAFNAFGKDIKTHILNYTQPVNVGNVTVGKPLGLAIVDPPNTVSIKNNSYQVKAKADGVNSASQISVLINGTTTTFNFDTNTGIISFNAPLNQGPNNIVVNAKNGKSSTTKSTTIIYEVEQPKLPPTVVITNPSPSPYTSKISSFSFKAQTTNITGNAQLEVKFNGNPITNYNFNSTYGSLEFNTSLVPNTNNVFEVKATNVDGVANASGIVYYNEVKANGAELKTKVICYAKDKINYQTLTIFENEWPAYKAKGAYEGACKASTGDGEPNLDPPITICHKNEDNVKQTITIPQSQWRAHRAHGDEMGACPKVESSGGANLDPPITICHKGENNVKQTITIPQSQWAAHQAHGDAMGACPKVESGGGTDLDPPITICHKNDDGSKQTIVINQSKWAEHAAHGDAMGACPKLTEGGGIGDPDITICHKAERLGQTIVIKQSQWAAHQAHGDDLGPCPSGNPEGGNNNEQTKICHKNNDGSKTTMVIPSTAWAMHQAHGDVLGDCSGTVTPGMGSAQDSMKICHKGENNEYQTIIILKTQWTAHQAHGDIAGDCPQQKAINSGDAPVIEPKKQSEEQLNQGRPVEQPKIEGSELQSEQGGRPMKTTTEKPDSTQVKTLTRPR